MARGCAGTGEGFDVDVVHQGIEVVIGPEAEALLDATFDVTRTDALGSSVEDAGKEDEGPHRVPVAIANAA